MYWRYWRYWGTGGHEVLEVLEVMEVLEVLGYWVNQIRYCLAKVGTAHTQLSGDQGFNNTAVFTLNVMLLRKK